jgi:hypothetical protein
MIFKRRLSAAVLVLLCSTLVATERGADFKFDTDDLQASIMLLKGSYWKTRFSHIHCYHLAGRVF